MGHERGGPPLSLVVLAAGLGRRYGGPKQVDGLGPAGEMLLEYTVHDALCAGFRRLVFVVRPELEAQLEQRFRGRLPQDVDVAWVRQPSDGRVRPWGTGHAVLSAATQVPGAFAVVNADDLYGRGSLTALASFLEGLRSSGSPSRLAMVGYPLAETLSPFGGVSRGICRVDAGGELMSVDETVDIRRLGPGEPGLGEAGLGERGPLVGRSLAGAPCVLSGEELVSMNLWGMPGEVFPLLEEGYSRFRLRPAEDPEGEYTLPEAVAEWVDTGRARVTVLPAQDPWCGVTHAADRARIVARLVALTNSGEYPSPLHFR